MVNLGTINEDAVARFYFSTAAADGGEENFSATLEEADIPIYKDGAVMTLDASTITITNIATGLYEVDIDTSNDADFTTGSEYWVLLDASDETIDTQNVSGVLGVFRIESASEKAVRLLREYLYPSDSTIATVTSNTSTAINLSDIVDAQTADDELVGLILAVHDATDDRVAHVVTTACTSKVATVELLGDGGAMNFTVAAGDHVWIVGYVDRQYDGTNLTEAGGTGDQLTAVPWNAAWDTEVESECNDALVAIHLDHLLAADYDPAAKPGTATALLNELVESDGGVSRFTANALEAITDDDTQIDASALNTAAAAIGADGSGLTEAGGTGDHLTAVPWNAAWDAEVESEVNDALVAANLDHVALTATTTLPAVGTYLGQVMHASTSGTFDRTTDSLEAIRNTAPLGTAMRGTDSAFLAASAPTNFSNMALTTGGAVTVGTNNDKTGYSLTQSFPTNFANMALTTGGAVTAGTVSDKTGYSLAAGGLDSVTLSEPTARPAWGSVTAKEAIAWNMAFNRNPVVSASTVVTLQTTTGGTISTASVTATTSQVTRGQFST